MKQLPEAFKGLADYNQFMLYKVEPSLKTVGKFNKIPTNPRSLYTADVTEPSNFAPLNEVLEILKNLGDEYGLLFAITKDDPFWFLDIDDAVVNGQWLPHVERLLNQLPGAAVEVSHSQKGLHVVGTGELPNHSSRYKPLNLEFYSWGRGISLTGHHARGSVYTPLTHQVTGIINNYFQPNIDTTDEGWSAGPVDEWNGIKDDDLLIQTALKSVSKNALFENKATFADLWNKDLEKLRDCMPDDRDCGYEESNADGALALHLAFWTGKDCERMLNLMWKSGLVRDKWTEHKTYLKITIQTAINKQDNVYTAGTSELSTTDLAPFIEKITMEGAEPNNVKNLIVEINQADIDIIDKEILGSLLYDTAKLGGVDIKKKTIIDGCCQGARSLQPVGDLNIAFPFIKASGKPKSTRENLEALLNHYNISCKYNLMSKDFEIVIPNSAYTLDNSLNCAISEIGSLCSRHELSKSEIGEYIPMIADANAYNPVDNWIQSNPWDGQDRIKSLNATLNANNPILSYKLLRRWLISAVAAIYEYKGVRAKGVLVLQGDQNAGKTSWFLRLLGDNPEWGKEGAILNPHDKDSVKQCVSRWIVELGELDATFRRADIAALKGYLGKNEDEFRRPYAKTDSKYPRRTVYFGSVNPKHYLHDATGNTRFWSIKCGDINYEHDIDVQQVWAQVAQLYVAKEQWWLTEEENDELNAYNLSFESLDPLQEKLLLNYDFDSEKVDKKSPIEILEALNYQNIDKKTLNDLFTVLTKLLGNSGETYRGRQVFMMPRQLHALDQIIT